MNSTSMRVAALALAIQASAAIGWSQDNRSWLDEAKPAPWNSPGMAIPAVPKVQAPIDDRCRKLARPSESNEDRRVRDRGWDLVGAYQGGWQVLIVRGTASYDGMCRPLQYQDFVFVRGTFAGTLSPQPMNSRTDGALGQVSVQNDTRLTAEYSRYAKADALCCPSRIARVVFDIAQGPPAVRPLSVTTSPSGQLAAGARNSTPAAGLAGTSWRLVRFEGGDGSALTPDDRAKYTLDFAVDGLLTARIDCNRGRGSWTSSGSGNLTLRPLALTRAQCPPGSLHDQIVKQWGNIRSYVIRNGHLFLALMADGGIYEFEPIATPR